MDSLSAFLQPSLKSAHQLNNLPVGFLGSLAPGDKNNSDQSPAALLEAAVGKIPGSFAPESVDSTADFSPQAVADRIVGYIDNSIARRAGSEIEIQSMLQQAREGIAQGISDARDTLDALGELSDKVAEEIDKTESFIFQGLDTLQQALISNQQGNNTLISESALYSSQFQQTSEASIEIVTQDGDRVAVNYSAFTQSVSKQSYLANEQGRSYAYGNSAESAIAFQFSVQGELDSDERESIKNLLDNIGKIAGQFFQGDVQAAFNTSLELGFGSEELKSFSLDFQQTTRVQVVEAYQRTEQLFNDVPLSASVNPRPAVDMLSQLEHLLDQAKGSTTIEQPERTVKSLLADMLDILDQTFDSPVKNYIKDLIDSY